jgi:transposase
MGYVAGVELTQSVLFPQSLDEYIREDNPVRFIDAYVADLDLVGLGFTHAQPSETGRPAYDPGDLLRLYIYGYLNRVRSSRRLEKEAQRNVEVMWLMRKLRPDFKTIADFRVDNRAALTAVFKQFVCFCRELDMFGGELVAIDGSKFRASNSRNRLFTPGKLADRLRRIEEQIHAYLAELDDNDQQMQASETEQGGLSAQELQARIAQLRERQSKYRDLEQQMKARGLKQIALTDADARLMPQSFSQGGGTVVAYNVQIAVDAKYKLIAAYEVTNDTNDLQQLNNMATQAKQALQVEHLEVVADAGYYDGNEVAACQAQGIEAYVAKPANSSKSLSQGLFSKQDFVYDAAADAYHCPAGNLLAYRFTASQEGRALKHYYASTPACASCELRAKCTNRTDGGPRQVTRLVNEEALERMAQRMAAQPQKFRSRKELAEHPFGTLKRAWNSGHLLLRGLGKVNAEGALKMLAYNMHRAISVLGVPALIAALG